MKVALVCDHLLERESWTPFFEQICDLFPKAPIFTYAHKEGGILGPLQYRKIYSSYLSRFVADSGKLKKWTFLIPGLKKSFQIPSSYKIVIGVSAGLSHQIQVEENTAHFSFLFSTEGLDQNKKNLSSLLFAPYLKRWSFKLNKSKNYYFVSSQDLKQKYLNNYDPNKVNKSIVDAPTFVPGLNTRDFSLQHEPQEYRSFCFVVDPDHLELAYKWAQYTSKNKIKTIFVGPDNFRSLVEQKGDSSFVEYWGERCEGELSRIIQNSIALIDLAKRAYPYYAFASLACGRPILVLDHPINRELLGEIEGIFYTSLNKDLSFLNRWIEQLMLEHEWCQSKLLRRKVLGYNIYNIKNLILENMRKAGLPFTEAVFE